MHLRILVQGAFLAIAFGLPIARSDLHQACAEPISQSPRAESAQLKAADPLPSWNEGDAKTAILRFVERTTQEGSPDLVPAAERIAVFDNDGTLWPENPLPFEVAFSLDIAREMMAENPKLKESPAYRALAEKDIPALTENHLHLLLQLVADTHGGRTIEEFAQNVERWIATARHPRFKQLYADCTYQPMQEVLSLLRAHGYKTFIVSGGTAAFMRVWSEKVYGIPPEQVVGTVFKAEYELRADTPTLTILSDLVFVDDKAGKPVGIYQFIGRRPAMCFGNSDGDYQMLQWTTIDQRPSFGLLVHHTDAEREYAYDAHPKSSGKLVEALAAAPKRDWIVVDMKKDWKRIFTFEE